MHCIFQDDPCTRFVVGELKYINARVPKSVALHEFQLERAVNLADERMVLVRHSSDLVGQAFELCTAGQPLRGRRERDAKLRICGWTGEG